MTVIRERKPTKWWKIIVIFLIVFCNDFWNFQKFHIVYLNLIKCILMEIVKHRWKPCLGWMHGWMAHFWCDNGVLLCIAFDQMNMTKLTYPLIYLLKIKFRLVILLSKKLYNYLLIKISSTKFSNGILNPKIWTSHLIGTSQNEKILIFISKLS
jgi:hypothetical protein